MTEAAPREPQHTRDPQFPVLDTVRLIGALAVLTTHTAFQAGDYVRHGVWGDVLGRLDVGVAIFFVLSGFLLSRPHLARAADRAPQPSTGRYYWKRVIRIFPVYVVTVVIALTLIPDNDGVGFLDWLRTLLLLDTYVTDELPHGLTQMWSLAVEVAFYAVLPLLMLAAIGRGRPLRSVRVLAVLAAMTALSLAWHVDLAGRLAGSSPGLPLTWLPSYLTWFAVGIALALAHVRHERRPGSSRPVQLLTTLGAMPGTCWAMVAGLMLVASTPVAGPTLLVVASPAESVAKHVLYALIGGLVVLTGVFGGRGRYAEVMSGRLPRHLGHISYSMFCIHLPVLTLVMTVGDFELFGGHGLVIWLWTLALSLVASELLYRLVEKPGMRLRNLRGRSLRRPRGSASTTPATTPSDATTR